MTALHNGNGSFLYPHKEETPGTWDAEEDRHQLVHKAAHRLAMRASGLRPSNREMTKKNYDKILEALLAQFADFPKGVLTRIAFHPVNYLGLGEVLTLTTYLKSATPEKVDDYLALHPAICQKYDNAFDADIHINTLSQYPELHPSDIHGSEYPEERRRQAESLVALHHYLKYERGMDIEAVADNGEEVFIIKDEKLRDLLFNAGPDRSIADVVALIIERGILDADALSELLSVELHAAVSTGTL